MNDKHSIWDYIINIALGILFALIVVPVIAALMCF